MSAVFSAIDDHFIPDRQVAQLRIPPHSVEAESSVLGGLLLDNQAWDRVGDLLVDRDFYRYEHRMVFSAISALVNASKPADVITVFEHMQNQGRAEEIGGLAYLNSLVASTSAKTSPAFTLSPSCLNIFFTVPWFENIRVLS